MWILAASGRRLFRSLDLGCARQSFGCLAYYRGGKKRKRKEESQRQRTWFRRSPYRTTNFTLANAREFLSCSFFLFSASFFAAVSFILRAGRIAVFSRFSHLGKPMSPSPFPDSVFLTATFVDLERFDYYNLGSRCPPSSSRHSS